MIIAEQVMYMELSDEIYERIEEYCEEGNAHCDEEDWDKTIVCFNMALELLPEPKDDWEAATWIYAALGDALFFLGRYEDALDKLNLARMCPDGIANPFILLRLGESHYELGDMESAKRYLAEAYMMEGTDIFENEKAEYLDLVKQLIG